MGLIKMSLQMSKPLLILILLCCSCQASPVTNANGLETTIVQSTKNATFQSFHVTLKLKQKTLNLNKFGKREISISITKSGGFVLEQRTLQLDDSELKVIDFVGRYMGLKEWVKLDDGYGVRIFGHFTNEANKQVLHVDEIKRNKTRNTLLRQVIKFDDQVKLKMYLKSANGQLKDVIADSLGVISCRVYSKTLKPKPKFEKKFDFSRESITYDDGLNEIKLSFMARREDNSRIVWCVVDNVNRSLTVRVVYPPSSVKTETIANNLLKTGSRLQCTPEDGHPTPVTQWEFVFGPKNASRYYELRHDRKTFVLKDNAPIGSQWQMKCKSANKFGQYFELVNFTAEVNEVKLLEDRLAILESKLQRILQDPSAFNSCIPAPPKKTESEGEQLTKGNRTTQLLNRMTTVESKLQGIFDGGSTKCSSENIDCSNPVTVEKCKTFCKSLQTSTASSRPQSSTVTKTPVASGSSSGNMMSTKII